MKFYLEKDEPITHDFWESRPTAQKFHLGWDHPGSLRVVAPEKVEVRYQILRQHGNFGPDIEWPNGTWWPFSRFYEWWAGGMVIASGASFTYVFMHVDPFWIYERWRTLGLDFRCGKMRKEGDYTSYVIPEINFRPEEIQEGEFLCWSGISGFDDSPHLHVQVVEKGKNQDPVLRAVDPALIWPDIYERCCKDKHLKGV